MKRLAVDHGSVRIGIAISTGSLALAREAVVADADAVANIIAIANLEKVDQIIVGNPLGLSGNAGQAALRARELAESLASSCELDVRLLDERLTTASASRKLRSAGKSSRQQRAIIDSQAAVELLEFAISLAERNQPVGERVGGCDV